MRKLILASVLFLCSAVYALAGNYENFRVTTYAMVQDVNKMGDLKALEAEWAEFTKAVKPDKIYLETFRDMIFVDEDILKQAIKFFKDKGLIVSGGITFNSGNSQTARWETFCYSNPETRALIKRISETSAKYFDEILLDDYYFTNCKCKLCVAARGDRSWSEFRTSLLNQSAKELIVDPSHAVNPNCRVVVKFPNWYEHFQGLGFDLEKQPFIFDAMYTGTETRDPKGEQHLQPYESFSIYRYFHNLRPGYNDGGWVDTGSSYLDMFPEQLWMTVLAKAPEITLWNYASMKSQVRNTPRPWSQYPTSFHYEDMMKEAAARGVTRPTYALVADYALRQADKIIGKLGTPKGIKSYKPFHSVGEDYLQNYMGMIGVPTEIVPQFPEENEMVLLTESASKDPDIISKIDKHLLKGGEVVVTSGFYRAMQGNGIEKICEMVYTDRKAQIDTILVSKGWQKLALKTGVTITIPQMTYMTNDSWEEITTLSYGNGWPLFQRNYYGAANFFLWVIPENFSHLYALPADVLNSIRVFMDNETGIHIEGPAQVALFTYDNGTFVVESFLNEPVTIQVVVHKSKSLTDLATAEVISGKDGPGTRVMGRQTHEITRFPVTLQPHSFRGFSIDK